MNRKKDCTTGLPVITSYKCVYCDKITIRKDNHDRHVKNCKYAESDTEEDNLKIETFKEENLNANDFKIEKNKTDDSKIIMSKKLYECFQKNIEESNLLKKESNLLKKEVNDIKKEIIDLKTNPTVINGNIIIQQNI